MAYVKKSRWTANQTNFLRANYQTITDEEMAKALGRTLKAVRRKREEMELEKKMGRPPSKAANSRPQIAQPPEIQPDLTL